MTHCKVKKFRLEVSMMGFYHSVIPVNKPSGHSLEVKKLKLGDCKAFS